MVTLTCNPEYGAGHTDCRVSIHGRNAGGFLLSEEKGFTPHCHAETNLDQPFRVFRHAAFCDVGGVKCRVPNLVQEICIHLQHSSWSGQGALTIQVFMSSLYARSFTTYVHWYAHIHTLHWYIWLANVNICATVGTVHFCCIRHVTDAAQYSRQYCLGMWCTYSILYTTLW